MSIDNTLHDASEPDQAPRQWCSKCATHVTPTKPTGQCPGCGRPLLGSSLARKRRVNKVRVKELLDKFILDYQPNTQRLRSMCEQFAAVTEQLETVKLGTLERARLAEESQRLGGVLEASRSSRASTHDDTNDLTNDQLIEQTTAILRTLLRARDFEAAPCSPEGVDGGPAPDAFALAPDAPVPGEGGSLAPAGNAVPTAAPTA